MAAGILVWSGLWPFPNARAETLAVSSMTDGKIYYVSPAGSVSPLATINYYPEGVSFGPGSTAIHVVNWGGNLINRVSSGGAVSTFVTNIVDPYGLAFDSQTNLFVACYQLNRVKKISPAKVITDFATVPGAYSLALDAADNVFVAGLGNRLYRITRDGSSSLFGPPIAGTLRGVAVDADGYIYVASLSGTITLISQSGAGSVFATGLPDTVGLAFDSAGNLYATGGNPLITMANSERLREAFQELELLVVLDIFLNETASVAHYAQPCTSPLERPDLPFIFPLALGLQSRPYLQATKALVKPQGEQRDEATIYLQLARACGVNLFASAAVQRALEGALKLKGLRRGHAQPRLPEEALLSLILRVSGQGGFKKLLADEPGRARPPHQENSFLGKRVITDDGLVDLAPPALPAHARTLESAAESPAAEKSGSTP